MFSLSLNTNLIVAEIEKELIRAGAVKIEKLVENGHICALTFFVRSTYGEIPVRLPAKFHAARELLKKLGVKYNPDLVDAVAWDVVKDWVNAQIPLLDAGFSKIHEVFLPYVVLCDGKTVFQMLEAEGKRLRNSAFRDHACDKQIN